MSRQLESGTMTPVIKYIRHRRDKVQGIMVSANAEAEALPLSAMLLYNIDGGSDQHVDMHYDGSDMYSVTLEGVPDRAGVTYHVVVSDRDGRTNVKPCDAAVIRPLSGDTPLLFINEFMADNEETVTDEHGNYSDWIEIYNGDNKEIYLGDLYLTDNFDNPGKWQLPGISLAPGGFALFWADGGTAPGDHHASFKLSKEGEEIGLYDADLLMIDTLSFGLQLDDISSGRKTDGAPEIVIFYVPTPGKSNNATSAGEVQAPNRLIVYPNPAYDGMVRINEKINCTIYNSRGTTVFKGKEVDEIDLHDYPAGLYIIVTDDGRRIKFIVARSD